MNQEIGDILEIQKYLIWGFIDYGYAQDYKDIIPAKVFGVYEPMFKHLSENGNVKTPDFYSLCTKIGNKYFVEAMERSNHSFITDRDKYIERIFNYYVTNVLLKDKSPIDVLHDVKDTYVKLAYIKANTQGGIAKIDTLLSDLHDEIAEAVEYGDKSEGYKTGIKSLDRYTGWLVKGRTVRLSAYSNIGKSAFSYGIVNQVLAQGAKVLYFSLEIPKEDLRNRLLSNWHKIPMFQFDKKSSLTKLDFTEYSKKDLFLCSDIFSMDDIEKMVQTVKPDVVFIDYVQLVKGEGKDEYSQMNDVARRIRKMTADFNVAVFDLSQVPNDSVKYHKGGLIPSKGSGELVSAANIVLVMEESKYPGKLNLYIAKNRHGMKWKCIELIPHFETCTFEDNGEIDPDNKAI